MLTIYYITALDGTTAYYWTGDEWSSRSEDRLEFRIEEEGVNEYDVVFVSDYMRNMSLEKGERFNG